MKTAKVPGLSKFMVKPDRTEISINPTTPSSIASRLTGLNWSRIGTELDAHGYTNIGPTLTRSECETLVAGYDTGDASRSHVIMSRHGFGQDQGPPR